jgi:hypothetical protein
MAALCQVGLGSLEALLGEHRVRWTPASGGGAAPSLASCELPPTFTGEYRAIGWLNKRKPSRSLRSPLHPYGYEGYLLARVGFAGENHRRSPWAP